MEFIARLNDGERMTEGQAEPAKELLDRLLAVCWRLTERGKPGKEVQQVG